ncbi:MAG: hypothetical protein M3P51_13500 [Chloroflexota bacterium]|nr:hypothetical protein [Chloroflexota bacterium]
MLYCEQCGLANREGSRYCNGCGQSLVIETVADEPLPTWLREAAVAGYLWKGDMLLPSWLAEARPFRELYGGGAVVLPPPFKEITEPDAAPVTSAQHDTDEISFLDAEEIDEEGPVEGDLLLLDDLDLSPTDDHSMFPESTPHGLEAAVAREPVEPSLASVQVDLSDSYEHVGETNEPGPQLSDTDDLIVEVVAPVLSEHEPEPLLDETGTPLPVTVAELEDEEELVAVVSVAPEDEPLLQGVLDDSAEPALDLPRFDHPPTDNSELPPDTLGVEPAQLEEPADESPEALTAAIDTPAAQETAVSAPSLLDSVPEFNPVPAEPAPISHAPSTESGRRFQSAVEYVLESRADPEQRRDRRKRGRRS